MTAEPGMTYRAAPHSGVILMATGALVLAVGIWGLWRDVAPISTMFYVPAWWGLIFLADGFCVLRRGSSLLTARRRDVPYILITSVTFWMFFELLNARFENWYYIGTIRFRGPWSLLYAGAFAFLAFSTVFMGMFEIHDAVGATGLFRNWRGRPGRALRPWVPLAIQVCGAIMACLAIARPYYLAPLIWGSFSFLVDPVNYRKGARSILRDIENREWGVVARLLLAGLISGLVWESANFFAPQKWVYTVRGLENFKLFEMPLLGFLGFPGLMIDAMAAYGFFSWAVLGNSSWENPQDVRHPMPARAPLPPRVFRMSLVPQVAFWVLIGATVAPIGSVELDLADLPRLNRQSIATLNEAGVRSPMQLLQKAAEGSNREQLRRRLGHTEPEFQALVDQAELYTFKGIGHWYGPLLEEVGVTRVEHLAAWEPAELYDRLRQSASTEKPRHPTRDMVTVWVLAARSRSILQISKTLGRRYPSEMGVLHTVFQVAEIALMANASGYEKALRRICGAPVAASVFFRERLLADVEFFG